MVTFNKTASFSIPLTIPDLRKLSAEQKRIGVIAASAGNHAQALAYHGDNDNDNDKMKKWKNDNDNDKGGLLDIPVTVVMPIVAPIMKVMTMMIMIMTIMMMSTNKSKAEYEG